MHVEERANTRIRESGGTLLYGRSRDQCPAAGGVRLRLKSIIIITRAAYRKPTSEMSGPMPRGTIVARQFHMPTPQCPRGKQSAVRRSQLGVRRSGNRPCHGPCAHAPGSGHASSTCRQLPCPCNIRTAFVFAALGHWTAGSAPLLLATTAAVMPRE